MSSVLYQWCFFWPDHPGKQCKALSMCVVHGRCVSARWGWGECPCICVCEWISPTSSLSLCVCVFLHMQLWMCELSSVNTHHFCVCVSTDVSGWWCLLVWLFLEVRWGVYEHSDMQTFTHTCEYLHLGGFDYQSQLLLGCIWGNVINGCWSDTFVCSYRGVVCTRKRRKGL